MESIKFHEHFDELCSSLDSHGAFLVVKDKQGRSNIMTIGWATLGVVWTRPVMTVFVRPVRYTYELIENASSFTVCVPDGKKLDKALIECGTKSGRDMDKASLFGLSLVDGKLPNTSVIKECKLIYECKIIEKNKVDPGTLDQEIANDLYPKKDFHTVYYGEIKYSYKQ
jgi:flavin reductase (DIM6/NTAB) family NADH-FMN oxidoreductase RutF